MQPIEHLPWFSIDLHLRALRVGNLLPNLRGAGVLWTRVDHGPLLQDSLMMMVSLEYLLEVHRIYPRSLRWWSLVVDHLLALQLSTRVSSPFHEHADHLFSEISHLPVQNFESSFHLLLESLKQRSSWRSCWEFQPLPASSCGFALSLRSRPTRSLGHAAHPKGLISSGSSPTSSCSSVSWCSHTIDAVAASTIAGLYRCWFLGAIST